MVYFSLRYDPVPASVKIDLELHKPYRTWFGLGRLRCEWCRHKWGAHGCLKRRSAKDKTAAIWHHAARHEAEVEG